MDRKADIYIIHMGIYDTYMTYVDYDDIVLVLDKEQMRERGG